MLQLNGKNLCENCFSMVDINGVCPKCKNIPQARVSSALALNSILHGRYVIGKVLGKGGFSITYLAYDNKLDKVIAIKEFFPDMIVSRSVGESQVRINSPDNVDVYKTSVQRFYEEAKMISELHHPNIIDVYNLYYENGTAFYTMEYLDGGDLRYYVVQNNGKISENALMPIIAGVAEALETVHSRGLLHRDVAPDNIFLTKDGQVKLIDFGAARSTLANGGEGFSVVIKQGFAPVEQYQRHGNQGPWTDIYALGATMYYCLNGKMPPMATERITNPQLFVMGNSPIYSVIDKMMRVDPQDRYQSIAEFKKALFNSIQLSTVQNQESKISNQLTEVVKPNNNSAVNTQKKNSGSYKWLFIILGIVAAAFLGMIMLIFIIIFLLNM